MLEKGGNLWSRGTPCDVANALPKLGFWPPFLHPERLRLWIRAISIFAGDLSATRNRALSTWLGIIPPPPFGSLDSAIARDGVPRRRRFHVTLFGRLPVVLQRVGKWPRRRVRNGAARPGLSIQDTSFVGETDIHVPGLMCLAQSMDHVLCIEMVQGAVPY